MNQMRSMGDLASSVGKSFDQLAEAILDAQSGEFERLKEFGIKSKDAGDNVIFTFKGIETQVKKSDEAIQEYLLSLGDLKGVAGSMESISKTTGGLISNLQDNIVGFFKGIGDSSSGFINWFIKDLNRVVTTIRNFSEVMEGLNPFSNINEKSEEFRRFLLKTSEATTDTGLAFKDFAATFDKVDIKKILGDNQFRDLFIQSLIKEGQSLEEAESLWETYITLRKEAFDAERKLNTVKKEGIKTDDLANEKARDRAEALKKLREEYIKEQKAKTREFIRSTQTDQRSFFNVDDSNLAKVAENVSKITKQIIDPALAKAKENGLIIPQDYLDRQQAFADNQENINQKVALTQSLAGMLGSTFQSAFEGMLNSGKVSFRGIIDGLKALVIKLIAAAVAAFALAAILSSITGGGGLAMAMGAKSGGLKDIFKMFFSGMSGLNFMAEGGMVTGLTTAILGDNPSGKEAVIPFEKMGSFLSQYGTGGSQDMRVEVVGRISGEDIFFSGLNYSNGRNKIIGG
jgi:hypothetical protein